MRNLLIASLLFVGLIFASAAQAGPPGYYQGGFRGARGFNAPAFPRPVPRVSLYGVGGPGLYPTRFDFGGAYGGVYGRGYNNGYGYGYGYNNGYGYGYSNDNQNIIIINNYNQ